MKARYAPARDRMRFRLTGWLALALLLQQPVQALAQAAAGEYRLQGGDEIVLSVPGRPGPGPHPDPGRQRPRLDSPGGGGGAGAG